MFIFRQFKNKEQLPFRDRMIKLVIVVLIVWVSLLIGSHIFNKTRYIARGIIFIPQLEKQTEVMYKNIRFKVVDFDYTDYTSIEDTIYIKLEEIKN